MPHNDITLSAYTVARETHRRATFKVYEDDTHSQRVDVCVGEMHLLFGDVDSARAFAYGMLSAINEASRGAA